MKPNRNASILQVYKGATAKENQIACRMKNQLVILSKDRINDVPAIILTFVKAEPYNADDYKLSRRWLRGKSRFNISVAEWPVSEDMMRLFYQMIGHYQREFETPIVDVPKRPKIILPGQ